MPSQQHHIKAALKLIRQCARRCDLYPLFSDLMELCAITISNSVDLRTRDRREARYLEVIGRYDQQTIDTFPRIFAELVLALEAKPSDVLGVIFSELEIHNSDRGQFFTPYPICELMARVTLGDPDSVRRLINEQGFVAAMEPACGAGGMVIALAEAMRAEGINYQRYLHVSGVDIDARAAHMAYIQFSLLHIPAEVAVGNSLSMEFGERWFTPAHVLGGWTSRLAAHCQVRRAMPASDHARPLANERPAPTAEQFLTPGTQLSLF